MKGCKKPISDTDNLPCGSWWAGDQHFCKKCFKKNYPEHKNPKVFKESNINKEVKNGKQS